jgi:hypothetical protein
MANFVCLYVLFFFLFLFFQISYDHISKNQFNCIIVKFILCMYVLLLHHIHADFVIGPQAVKSACK